MDLLFKISSALRYKKIGIVVACKKKSGYDMSYYQMVKKGNSVDTCFCQECVDSFDEISVQPEKYPTILCIQGTGLVQRMMNGGFADIKQNIPNINIDEYVIELDETNQGEKLVALCRKEQVESILNLAVLQRIPLHSISMGFIGISKYLMLFSEDANSFGFGGSSIHFKSNEIVEIRKNISLDSEDYFFAGKLRKASEILALAAGLNYFTGKTWNNVLMPGIKEKVKEYTARRITSFILSYVVAVMFVLLLFNFLLFDHYNTKRDQLEIESSGISTVKNEINRLKNDLSVKRQFIQQNDIPDNFAFAYYADRLASFVPEGVGLKELAVCPVINKVKEDKVIGFQSNTIRVIGIADNSATFSIFLDRINKSLWVSKIEKQVYNYNNDNDNADFELEILLKNAIY
jgi:Tfp pilus assembly protein PilN